MTKYTLMIKSCSIIIENKRMNEVKNLIEKYAQHRKNNEEVSRQRINSIIIDIYSSRVLASNVFDNIEIKDRKKIINKDLEIFNRTMGTGMLVSFFLFTFSCYLGINNYFTNSLYFLMSAMFAFIVPLVFSMELRKFLARENINKNSNDIYNKVEDKYKKQIKNITLNLIEEIDSNNHYDFEIKESLKKVLIDGNYKFETNEYNQLFDDLKLKVLTDFTLNDKVINKTKLISKKDEKLEDINVNEMLILNKKLDFLKKS